jgi:hypothetical protein
MLVLAPLNLQWWYSFLANSFQSNFVNSWNNLSCTTSFRAGIHLGVLCVIGLSLKWPTNCDQHQRYRQKPLVWRPATSMPTLILNSILTSRAYASMYLSCDWAAPPPLVAIMVRLNAMIPPPMLPLNVTPQNVRLIDPPPESWVWMGGCMYVSSHLLRVDTP